MHQLFIDLNATLVVATVLCMGLSPHRLHGNNTDNGWFKKALYTMGYISAQSAFAASLQYGAYQATLHLVSQPKSFWRTHPLTTWSLCSAMLHLAALSAQQYWNRNLTPTHSHCTRGIHVKAHLYSALGTVALHHATRNFLYETTVYLVLGMSFGYKDGTPHITI